MSLNPLGAAGLTTEALGAPRGNGGSPPHREIQTTNLGVGGSNPSGRASYFKYLDDFQFFSRHFLGTQIRGVVWGDIAASDGSSRSDLHRFDRTGGASNGRQGSHVGHYLGSPE